MKIIISINYHAAPGNIPVLQHIKGNGATATIDHHPMTGRDGGYWTAELFDHQLDNPSELCYNFCVTDEEGNTVRSEWPEPHRVELPVGAEVVNIDDRWLDVPPQLPMMSSAFTRSIFRRQGVNAIRSLNAGDPFIEFEVLAPQVSPEQTLVMTGDHPLLGNWNPAESPRLSDSHFPYWRHRIPMGELPDRISYKFCIIEKATGNVVRWEEYENRQYIKPHDCAPSQANLVKGLMFEQRHTSWRGTGTVIPIFSLRTAESFGIGDFYDLRLMVDWVAATGQNFLQILPINDTTMSGTWTDSYPYNSISVFALHPIYLRVEALGNINDSSRALLLATRKKALNSLQRVDYEQAFSAKMEYARTIYQQEGHSTLSSAEYQAFARSNAEWLDAYAAFSLLRDRHHTADITRWGEHATYDEQRIATLLEQNRHEADFYRYLQYHLHCQLKSTVEYAHTRGVIIKGDIAIGISRNSVDAWKYPHLFNLNWCAGAPPDDFATDGQNWGFPTYNWERMAQDDYAWWRARLRKMAEYFDAYRIDHLLGFFRIWQIPKDKHSGLLGIFSPSLPMSTAELKERFDFDVRADYTVPHSSPTDLLLIEDVEKIGYYHPAINGCKTPLFNSLTKEQQDAFGSFHEEYFYRRHDEMWGEEAMRKLTLLLTETHMLACGEDLGMIPSCVKPVMDKLRILSLEVQRMPKTYGVEWADTAFYPHLSVATTSTHDMPTLRMWLDEKPEIAHNLLSALGVDDLTDLSAPHCCEAVIENHLSAPSMLCILPWQDWMSISGTLRHKEASEEVINIPAVSNHYWRYRMHLSIEELLASDELNARIRSLIERTR